MVIQNRPVDELRADWQTLEDAGIHTLWLADHLMTFPKMGTLLEAWTTLGALAASTKRIRLGVLVTNITYRNPALLTKEAITIDHLSGGRLEIGVGAGGTRRDDAQVAGVDEWSVAERADRFEEFVQMLDELLRGTDAHDGKYYRTEGFERGPWPMQSPRPPLTIAAQGPRTLQVAARYADTWNTLAGFGRSGEELIAFLRSCNQQLDEFASEFERSPNDIRRSILVQDSGFPWFQSAAAFDDFVGRVRDTGIEDFVFYYPPYAEAAGKIGPGAFLDLLARLATP